MRQAPRGSILGPPRAGFRAVFLWARPRNPSLTDRAACTLPPMQIPFTRAEGMGSMTVCVSYCPSLPSHRGAGCPHEGVPVSLIVGSRCWGAPQGSTRSPSPTESEDRVFTPPAWLPPNGTRPILQRRPLPLRTTHLPPHRCSPLPTHIPETNTAAPASYHSSPHPFPGQACYCHLDPCCTLRIPTFGQDLLPFRFALPLDSLPLALLKLAIPRQSFS